MQVSKLKDLEFGKVYKVYTSQVIRKSNEHWSNWYYMPLKYGLDTVAGEDIVFLVTKPGIDVMMIHSVPLKEKSKAFSKSLFREIEDKELKGYYRRTFDTIFNKY